MGFYEECNCLNALFFFILFFNYDKRYAINYAIRGQLKLTAKQCLRNESLGQYIIKLILYFSNVLENVNPANLNTINSSERAGVGASFIKDKMPEKEEEEEEETTLKEQKVLTIQNFIWIELIIN